MKGLSLFGLAATVVSFTIAAPAALADNIKFLQTTGAGYSITSGSDPLDLRLTDAGATLVSFNNPTRGLVSVTYSAECSVASTVPEAWVSIEILINGVAVPPTTGIYDALCTNAMTDNTESYGMNSITVAKSLPAGNHTLKVRAILGNGAGSATGRIDDQTILIAR